MAGATEDGVKIPKGSRAINMESWDSGKIFTGPSEHLEAHSPSLAPE